MPCLNEARQIGPLVAAIRCHLPTVIVVDDGSTDDTGMAARQAGAEVIWHEQPRGKGAALIAGLQRAVARGFAHALTMDGDGQHSPEDIPALLSRADATGAALVIGNRMGNASAMPPARRWVNRWMSRRLGALFEENWPDTQCGFRLVRLAEWRALPFGTAHFEYESEMLCAYTEAGYRIEFVPVQVIYRGERSKIHPLRDTVRWFRWFLRCRRQLKERRKRAAIQPATAARNRASIP